MITTKNSRRHPPPRSLGSPAQALLLCSSTETLAEPTTLVPNRMPNGPAASSNRGRSGEASRIMNRLLLIDDDPALIPEQVRQAFPAPRYRVEVAGTGAEGLERVGARPPDVILLDLRLPDQSGLEVYQQIRKIDARIPVIFVTMAKTADAAIEAMKQGAYDYLFKPLDLHQLRRVVGEALEVARRMREPAVFAETAPTRTWTAPSSAPAPPCARSTRPSAASPPRTCRC